MEFILEYVLSTYGVAFAVVLVVFWLLMPAGLKDKIKQAINIVRKFKGK